MSTHDTMLAALKAAEPVLADIDRHLRAKHPGMQTLEALATVRAAIAAAPVAHHGLEATGVATHKSTNVSDKPPQAEGWVMVPVEPTQEMLEAARTCHKGRMYPQDDKHGPAAMRRREYVAMLAAAPSAPTAEWNTERGQRCPHCDGTGDVHSIDGQWRGRCYCPEGQATPSAPTEKRPQNCGTGFCSCIECPYHDQPRATSCECSK